MPQGFADCFEHQPGGTTDFQRSAFRGVYSQWRLQAFLDFCETDRIVEAAGLSASQCNGEVDDRVYLRDRLIVALPNFFSEFDSDGSAGHRLHLMSRGSPQRSFEQDCRRDEADGHPQTQLGGQDEGANHGSGLNRASERGRLATWLRAA